MRGRAIFLFTLFFHIHGADELEIPHLNGNISIDGKLDEATWADAVLIDTLKYRTKGTGPIYSTNTRLFWDDEGFYVGVDAYDPAIIIKMKDCEPCTSGSWRGGDDIFELHISPDTSDIGILFVYEVDLKGCTNEHGRRYSSIDGSKIPGGDINCWKANVEFKASWKGTPDNNSDTDEGWTMEMRLPFSSLAEFPSGDVPSPDKFTPASPPSNGDIWFFNLTRIDHQLLDVKTNYSNIRWHTNNEGSSNHTPLNSARIKFVKDPGNVSVRDKEVVRARCNNVKYQSGVIEWNIGRKSPVGLKIFSFDGKEHAFIRHLTPYGRLSIAGLQLPAGVYAVEIYSGGEGVAATVFAHCQREDR